MHMYVNAYVLIQGMCLDAHIEKHIIFKLEYYCHVANQPIGVIIVC